MKQTWSAINVVKYIVCFVYLKYFIHKKIIKRDHLPSGIHYFSSCESWLIPCIFLLTLCITNIFSVTKLASLLFFSGHLSWPSFCSFYLSISILSVCLPSPFLMVLGAWTMGLVLARQVLYHLNHIPCPFCLSYFWDRVSPYAQASLYLILPIYVSGVGWRV
jgi:hypothetical protein